VADSEGRSGGIISSAGGIVGSCSFGVIVADSEGRSGGITPSAGGLVGSCTFGVIVADSEGRSTTLIVIVGVELTVGLAVEQPAVISGVLVDVQALTLRYFTDAVILLGVLVDSTNRIGAVVIPKPQFSARLRM
jgi:hypothetical protein